MKGQKALSYCMLCPRECKVNRLQGEKGSCKRDAAIFLARAALHFWEEPCISGKKGSGAVFFSGCPVSCVFCQNAEISRKTVGREVSIEELTDVFIKLQEQGAHNINLVTPTHHAPQIIEALRRAKDRGLLIPVVYNTSGYEKVETIRSLKGFVDIYLPDFKYMAEEPAIRYSKIENYADYAKKALAEMVKQVGLPIFNNEGMMQKGVIVRHLALPGWIRDSKKIIQYLYETYQNQIYISIMNQYTPLPHVLPYKELNRRLTKREYKRLVDFAIELGIENAFIQEGETAKESFIPAFDVAFYPHNVYNRKKEKGADRMEESRIMKFPSKLSNSIVLRAVPGHFATNHSHINYYIDMTGLKTRRNEAASVAKVLVPMFPIHTVVDTIVCMDGSEVIGAYLAEELEKHNFHSTNQHNTVYVITPEVNAYNQMIFRDNLIPTIKGKNILLLLATTTTGLSVGRSLECVNYYGGNVQAICSVFSAMKEIGGIPVQYVFGPEDIPGYQAYEPYECPFCKQKQKIEAMVNGYGYSKLD